MSPSAAEGTVSVSCMSNRDFPAKSQMNYYPLCLSGCNKISLDLF